MPEQVSWTLQVQVAERLLFKLADTTAVTAYNKMRVMLPAGAVDQVVRILPDRTQQVVILAMKASQYVDPNDSTRGLRVKWMADGKPQALSGPFLLMLGGSLHAFSGALRTLFFTNTMSIAVEIQLLSARDLVVSQPAPRALAATVPPWDELTRIHGIGPVYRQRLYAAGINTFAALAAASVEQIEEIVKVQAWQAVDVASWIAQAQALTANPNP